MSAPVVVCIDWKSPQAWLALAPTRALETRLGVAFEWRPFSVPPLVRHPAASANEDRGARHRRIRSEYLVRDLERYAAASGLDLGDPYRNPDTERAALGLLWLRRHAPTNASNYVARVFELLWREEADIADPDVIAATLDDAARGFLDYAAGPGRAELAAHQGELAEAGVSGVPTYLIDGEPYLGRQHLPMVEWLATGRTGPPPI